MTLLDVLERSGATEPFREAVTAFFRGGAASDRLRFHPRCPAVKVERTLIKTLEAYPELPIDAVELDAQSGCEYFRGTVTIHAAGETRTVAFDWDCRWKAEEMGWTDWFGYPDQARAAREFGYACFRTWEEQPALETDASYAS